MTEKQNVGLTNTARSIINRLQDDLREKRTCRECLRSKTLPCSAVVEIANDGSIFGDRTPSNPPSSLMSSNITLRVKEVILNEYTHFLPSTEENAPYYSSLACINRIAVVPRFVQLLLLLSERQQQQQQQQQQQHISKDVMLLPSTTEVNKMMEQLLESWSNGICEFVREWKNDGNDNLRQQDGKENDDTVDEQEIKNYNPLTMDATRNLQSGPIFCYAFLSLLRMNDYVQKRGALLVSLWKGLCDLAETLLLSPLSRGVDNANDDDDYDGDENINEYKEWRKHVPPNLLFDAVRILGQFLREGKERLEIVAVQRCFSAARGELTNIDDSIVFQGKLVGFMVARMANLMRVYFQFCNINQSNKLINGHKSGPLDLLTNSCWKSLLGLRGMTMALELLVVSSKRKISSNEESFENEKDLSFFKVYQELSSKAEKCITEIVLLSNRNLISQQQHWKQRTSVLVQALDNLLQSDMMKADNDYQYRHNFQDNDNLEVIHLRDLSRFIGKSSILCHVLETVLNLCPVTETVESLLGIIENLHSTSLPQCLSACVIAVRGRDTKNTTNTDIGTVISSTIIHKSLKVMVRSLGKIEISREFMASSQQGAFYRLLVRWLGSPHPLSRELILSLLHIHILENGASHDKDGRKISVTKFLSYLTKVLMDVRTGLILRKNIASLLVRLQCSSTTNSDENTGEIADLTKKLIEQEFVTYLIHNSSEKSSKKRKRMKIGLCTTNDLQKEDLLVICTVLRGQGMSTNFSAAALSPVLCDKITRLSIECTMASVKSEKKLLKLLHQSILLFAWLERCLVGLSLPDFKAMTGKDIFIDILQPVFSLASNIKFHPGDSIEFVKKKVMIYASMMRLFTTMTNAFGDDGKLPFEQVCLLLKNLISSKGWYETENRPIVVKFRSILKFETLSLLGCIGKAIPNVCPEQTLRVRLM